MADEDIFQSSDSAASVVPDQCDMERRAGTDVDLIAYGFIYPILAIFVIFTNVNGIVVLLRMRNFTQTNMLLLAIFIVDLLTTVIPFPKFFLQFTINLNKPDIPKYPWCFLSSLLFPALPVITNSIRTWLIVVLIIQRFTYVWKRDIYNHVFSRSNVIIHIGAITLVTTLFHSGLLIDNYRRPLGCPSGSEHPEVFICNEDPKTYIIPGGTDVELYVLSSYYLSRSFYFHFIPILTIAVSYWILRPTTTKLKAESNLPLPNDSSGNSNPVNLKDILPRRCRMSTSAMKSSYIGPNKAQRMSTTTHMLMAISTIYLVQHTFQTILFVSGVALNAMHEMPPKWMHPAVTTGNLVCLASFPVNFFICLHFHTQFREVFLSMYRNCKIVEAVGTIVKPQADTSVDLSRPSYNMSEIVQVQFEEVDDEENQAQTENLIEHQSGTAEKQTAVSNEQAQ